MSERERYPPGVPCWVETLQPDPQSALDFYAGLFGWEFDRPGPMPGGLSGQYFVARLQGRDVAGVGSLPDLGGPPVPAWATYVRVEDVGEAAERATQAGGGVLMGPLDALPAGRLAVLSDPAGAVISVWEARAREGAQLVNEPRAWVMRSLHTSDPEGAQEFYGSLFGWQPESFGPVDASLTLWRLQGYRSLASQRRRGQRIEVIEVDHARGDCQVHRRADAAVARDRRPIRPRQRERLIDAAVTAPREHEDLRPAGHVPRQADRPAVRVGRGRVNDHREGPKRRVSSAATHEAFSVGIIAVRPPCPSIRRRIAATTGSGECPAIAPVSRSPGVAEREVDVLVAVDIDHAGSARTVQIQREGGGLVHPRHRHAAERALSCACVRAGAAWVSLREAGSLPIEHQLQAPPVDRLRHGAILSNLSGRRLCRGRDQDPPFARLRVRRISG